MNLEELMKTTPETLANEQYSALSEHVRKVLRKIDQIVEYGTYKEMDALLFYSPSGDCMGSDNQCINFGYKKEKGSCLDIAEVVGELIRLQKLAGLSR